MTQLALELAPRPQPQVVGRLWCGDQARLPRGVLRPGDRGPLVLPGLAIADGEIEGVTEIETNVRDLLDDEPPTAA